MATPNSRQSLIDYCLRRLGAPVIEINVDPDQIEDKVDDALSKYWDYHSEGTLRTYLKHQVTQTDITNGYITLNPSIIYVARVLPISNGVGASRSFFDVRYQTALNDITDMQSYIGDLAYYQQIQQYLTTLDMVMNGVPQVQFSRRMNRLYFWGDFNDGDVLVNDFIIVEVYEKVSPDTYTSIYNDTFMKDYTSALIKQQWGANLKKFENMQLPGGVTINGQILYDEATIAIDKILEDMRLGHEMPINFYVG